MLSQRRQTAFCFSLAGKKALIFNMEGSGFADACELPQNGPMGSVLCGDWYVCSLYSNIYPTLCKEGGRNLGDFS